MSAENLSSSLYLMKDISCTKRKLQLEKNFLSHVNGNEETIYQVTVVIDEHFHSLAEKPYYFTIIYDYLSLVTQTRLL